MKRKDKAYTALRQDDDGKRLYARWVSLRRRPHDPMFDDFRAFYDWSMRNGYTQDAKLTLIDESKPFTPENCTWREPQGDCVIKGEDGREWCRKWNEAVNRIRLYYGM